jgi:hypothetical protein
VAELAVLAVIFSVPVLGFLALRRSGAFLIAEEAALLRLERRLAVQHHRTVADRISRHPLLRKLDEARDLRRMLLIAGEDISPAVWGLRIASVTLAVAGLIVAVNVAGFVAAQSIWIPWQAAIMIVVCGPVIAILQLRLAVLRTRDGAGRAVAQLAAVLAGLGNRPPLRNPAHIESTDLVAMAAAWMDDDSLRRIVEGNRWRDLLELRRAPLPTSEAGWFETINELYDLPEAARLAEVVRIAREQNSADVAARYLQTARDLTRERLADLRARNRRQMITQVVPTLGLVASLLILVLSAVAAIHIGGS